MPGRLNMIRSLPRFRAQEGICHPAGLEIILSCSGEDGKVLGEAVDDKKEDGGGGDDEQQPLLVPLPVLGRDHSGADGDEEAGGEGDLQCEPVHDARLDKSPLV